MILRSYAILCKGKSFLFSFVFALRYFLLYFCKIACLKIKIAFSSIFGISDRCLSFFLKTVLSLVLMIAFSFQSVFFSLRLACLVIFC